jgi:AcrR family transcriptional regulator
MPKIIPEARKKILNAYRKLMNEDAENAPSLRSLAREAGIAPGTVYNYWANKDALILSLMIDDWKDTLGRMDTVVSTSSSFTSGIQDIIGIMTGFVREHLPVFHTSGSIRAETWYQRRGQMRREIAERIDVLLNRFGQEEDHAFTQFFVEDLLACLMQKDLSTDDLLPLASHLFHIHKEEMSNEQL